MSHWNVFSNHGHVLLFLARDPDARLRDVAASVGITERAVQKIMRDMQESGVISVSKHGRRNRYAIDTSAPLRHDLEAHCSVGELIALIAAGLPPDHAGHAPVRATTPPPVASKPATRAPAAVPMATPEPSPPPTAAGVPDPDSAETAGGDDASGAGTGGAPVGDGTGSSSKGRVARDSKPGSTNDSKSGSRPDSKAGPEREPDRESKRETGAHAAPSSKSDGKPSPRRGPGSRSPDDGEQGSLF